LPPLTSTQETQLRGHASGWQGYSCQAFAGELFLDRLRAAGGLTDIQKALVEQYQYVPKWVLKHFRHRPSDRDDLEQTALIALMKAAVEFDPSRNVKFTTVAVFYIRNAMRHFRPHRRQSFKEYPASSQTSDDFPSLSDIPDLEESTYDRLPIDILKPLLNTLSTRDRNIFILYWLGGYTLKEVGEQYDLCRERIRQIVESSLRAIRILAETATPAELRAMAESVEVRPGDRSRAGLLRASPELRTAQRDCRRRAIQTIHHPPCQPGNRRRQGRTKGRPLGTAQS
jgi:RNA polymerase sigma factor (sigma-70 family)